MLDNATTKYLLTKFPLTIPMFNAHEIKMIYRFDQPLPAEEVGKQGYEIGDIFLWTPKNALVIYYGQNGVEFENLQKVGHIDGDVSLFAKMTDKNVTFTK